MKVTVKEFADKFGVSQIESNGTLKWLESRGVAKIVEKRPPASGKGRASAVYEIDETKTAKDLFFDVEVTA